MSSIDVRRLLAGRMPVEPNMQRLPPHTKIGKELGKIIHATHDCVRVEVDVEQIEQHIRKLLTQELEKEEE